MENAILLRVRIIFMDLSTEKTWQFNVNQSIAAQGSTALTTARVLRLIKNSLTSFASSPWTVVGSSNGTTAGLDATDRWTTDSDVIWNAESSAHSWIVLKQTGVAANFQLLINCGLSTTVDNIYVSVSFSAGFTGGSATTKPTATDEIVLNNNSTWILGANAGRVLHVTQTSTGEQTRIFVWDNTNTRFMTLWMIDKFNNSTTLTYPYYLMVQGGNLAAITNSRLATDTGTAKLVYNNSSYGIAMTWEGYYTGSAYTGLHDLSTTQGPNEINGKYDLYKIGIASGISGIRGRHGKFYDLWWGVGGVDAAGLTANSRGTFDVNGTKTYAQLGMLIIPWNGTAVAAS